MSSLSSTNPSNTQTDVVRLNPQNHQSHIYTPQYVSREVLEMQIMSALESDKEDLVDLLYINQLNPALKLLETTSIIERAIQLNNVRALCTLYSSQKVCVSIVLFENVAINNRLDVVKEYLQYSIVPIDLDDIQFLALRAVEENNLDIFRYLIDNNHFSASIEDELYSERDPDSLNYRKRIFSAAARLGNVSFMEYLHSLKFSMDKHTFANAYHNNNLDAFIWLHHHNCGWDEYTVPECCRYDSIDCLKYAIQQHEYPIDLSVSGIKHIIRTCEINSSIECFKFFSKYSPTSADFWNIAYLYLKNLIVKIDLTDPFWNGKQFITMDLSRNPDFQKKVTKYYYHLSNKLVLEVFGHKTPEDEDEHIQSSVYVPLDLVKIFTQYNNL